jgi:hypothetical protein
LEPVGCLAGKPEKRHYLNGSKSAENPELMGGGVEQG